MITEANGKTIIDKRPTPQGDVNTPEINTQQQQQDITALSQPQTPATPIKGSETASIGSEVAMKIYKNLFKVVKPEVEKIAKPKKYIEIVKREVAKKKEADAKIAQDLMGNTPQDLVGQSTDNFSDKDPWQINFNTLENSDDVNGLIAAVAEKTKGDIQLARDGVHKDAQVKALADEIGVNPEFVSNYINSDASAFNSDAEVLAARKILDQGAIRLHELSVKIKDGVATDTEKLEFSKVYDFTQQLLAQFMGKRANIGRSLRAHSIPTGSNKGDAIKDMLMRMHSGLNIEDIAKQLATPDTKKGVLLMAQAQDGAFKKFSNVFMENFINSILSGIKTHIVNTTGSVLMLTDNIINSYFAAKLGVRIGTEEERMIKDEWKAGFFGLINGFSDGLKVAAEVMKTTEPYGGMTKQEFSRKPYITGEYLGLKGTAGTVVDTIGSIIRSPTERLMGGVDGMMKKLSEKQSLAQTAYRRATHEAQAKGLNQQEAMQLLQHYMQNPNEDMVQEAVESGLTVTFQKPLGDIGKKAQAFLHSNIITNYFAPFVGTPTNLMKEGFLKRTPLAYLTQEYKDAIKAGGAREQMAKARIYTGSALAIMSGIAATNGIITGSGPDNPKAKKALMDTGWRPNSFVIPMGKKVSYVSFNRLEPFSYIMTTIADFNDVYKLTGQDEISEDTQRHAERITGALIIAISHATKDRSFFTGLQNLADIFSQPSGGRVAYFLKSFANSNTPFSGLRRDTTRLFDSSKKLTDSSLHEIRANIPYISQGVPDRLDSHGNKMYYEGILNPWVVHTQEPSPIDVEVARLVQSTQKAPLSLPPKVTNGIRMSAENYHDLVLLSRKKIIINDKTYEQSIKETINSELYKKLIDVKKEQVLSSVKSTYDNAARWMLAKNSFSFRERFINRKISDTAKQMALTSGDSLTSIRDDLEEKYKESISDMNIEIKNKDDKALFYNKENK